MTAATPFGIRNTCTWPGARLPSRLAVDYSIGGESVRASGVVYRREANLPYGYEYRELKVVPALAVNVSPAQPNRSAWLAPERRIGASGGDQ